MAFKLFDELSNIMSDEKKFGSNKEAVMAPTGFDCFDYLNGSCSLNEVGQKEYQVGLDTGKICTIIGKSGSGKTTFALQTAWNIVKDYSDGSIFILDFEQSTDKRRIKMVTGMSDSEIENRVIIKKTGIYTETVFDTIMAIHHLKIDHEKELLVDSKVIGPDGKFKKIICPTVVLVDSIAMMMPKASIADSNEIEGQMLATAAAKMNTQLFKRIVQPCTEANIIPIFINHINQKVSTGPMPTQAQVNFLKPDETLPGGNAPIYLANTLIRITTAKKLEEDELFKIKGFMCQCSLVKSRTAAAGSSINLIYDQVNGFQNDLSNLQFLKDNKKVLGAGIGMYLEGYPDVKFSFSNFREKYNSIPEFKAYFDNLSKETLKGLIREASSVKKNYANPEDLAAPIILNE